MSATGSAAVRAALAVGAVALALGGCGGGAGADSSPAPAPSGAPVVSTQPFVGRVELAPDIGPAGSSFTLTATGLRRDHRYEVAWQRFDGHWKIDDSTPQNFKGRAYGETTVPLRAVETDGSGRLKERLRVPKGFGFEHDVVLLDGEREVNQAQFRVQPVVTLTRHSGPPGAPIEVTMRGIGASSENNSYQLLYDDRYTGWISAVTTDGTAHFSIPATGGPGRHVIDVLHGSSTFPYLNNQQAPYRRPRFSFTYTITPGAPVLPPAAATQGPRAVVAAPGAHGSAAPSLRPIRSAAPVGTGVPVVADGLPADTRVALRWVTDSQGSDAFSRVAAGATGAEAERDAVRAHQLPLLTATTDGRGALRRSVRVPEDAAGTHELIAVVGGRTVARSPLRVIPSALPLRPPSGPVGTHLTIEVKGTADTDTGKIYVVDYDNAEIGYACANSTHGDITIHLRATGAPGWHWIDLYPGIYKGTDIQGDLNFLTPQLTFAADHPGERHMPAFHFAFRVTG